MMAMTFSPPAKFVRRYADVAGVMRKALEEYRHDVEARTFPSDAESYHLSQEMRELMAGPAEVGKGEASPYANREEHCGDAGRLPRVANGRRCIGLLGDDGSSA